MVDNYKVYTRCGFHRDDNRKQKRSPWVLLNTSRGNGRTKTVNPAPPIDSFYPPNLLFDTVSAPKVPCETFEMNICEPPETGGVILAKEEITLTETTKFEK